MKKILMVFLAVSAVQTTAFASELSDLTATRDGLKAQLAQVQDEVKQCEKAKKTGKIMTIAGAVGTVGTGIGAGVQLKQLNDKKKELKTLETGEAK